jgi:hypothetical protein
MPKKHLKKLAIATIIPAIGCSFLSAKEAKAVTLTYNFGASNNKAQNFTYAPVGNPDGTTVSISGKEANRSRLVKTSPNGLGIIGRTGVALPAEIDGRGGDLEKMILQFQKPMKIISAAFSSVQRDDGFTLFIDGKPVLGSRGNSIDIPGVGSNQIFNFPTSVSSIVGESFVFSVGERNDDYKLKSATFAAVPEPASTLGLLAFGLFSTASTLKQKTQ